MLLHVKDVLPIRTAALRPSFDSSGLSGAALHTPGAEYFVVEQSGNMWLFARKALPAGSATFTVKGRLSDSCLGKAKSWKTRTPDAQRQAIASAADKYALRFSKAFTEVARAIVDFLQVCEEEQLSCTQAVTDLDKGLHRLDAIPSQLVGMLDRFYVKRMADHVAASIGASIKLGEYPDAFPAATRHRRLIALLGPTNSGKTYTAMLRLKTAASGMYLGPLRLLALEAYTRMNDEFGLVASLITGEERRIKPGSTVTAATVEMMDPSHPVEVAVIDEVQLLIDPDRGWAWTQAIAGANADEVWLLGSLSAEPALRALADRMGLPLEVRYTQRKNPLVVADAPLAPTPATALRSAEKGDAFIVFSRKDALCLRDDLLAHGKSVACVYGALSPEVREREAARFSSGAADILVATDAIGMGLNLPIQRIIFTAVQKYDGRSRGDLTTPLLQQIAGRAGRYGHQAHPGVAMGITLAEHKLVQRLMREIPDPLPTSGYQIAPTLNQLAAISVLSDEHRLEVLLALFLRHSDRGDSFFVPQVAPEQRQRAQFLDRLTSMPLADKFCFSITPLTTRNPELQQVWEGWARAANAGTPVALDFLKGQIPGKVSLADSEAIVQILCAYRWMGLRMPDQFPEANIADAVMPAWVAAIDSHLSSMRKQGFGSRGQGGRPAWYWEYREAADHG